MADSRVVHSSRSSIHSKHKSPLQPHCELLYPASPNNSPENFRIREWLERLTVYEREHVLAVENRWAASIARQMLARKLRDGEVVFRPKTDRSDCDPGRLEYYYEDMRPSAPHSSIDLEFEQYLRLKDTSVYLDTLTLSNALLSDLPRFFTIADFLTNSAAFMSPCCVFWDQNSRTWHRECPEWTAGRTLSLSQFALALIEQQCWTQYFAATKTDPRVPGETQHYTHKPKTATADIDAFAMADFWDMLDPDKRYSLAGDIKSLISSFVNQREISEANQQTNLEIASLDCCYTASFLTMFKNSSPYYSALRNKMQHFMVQASVDVVRRAQAEMDATSFIDFLLKTPLERSGTIIDYVIRSIAETIKEHIRQQIVTDLMLTDDFNQTSVSHQPKKRKKKGTKLSSNASTADSPCIKAASSPMLPDTSERSIAKEAASAVVEGILQLVYANSDQSLFETVQPSVRKKTKKGKEVQSERKVQEGKKQVGIKLSNPPKSNTKVQSQQPSAVVIWAEKNPQMQSKAIPRATYHFPPLAPTSTVSSHLSLEIQEFVDLVNAELRSKAQVLKSILQRLHEVISFIYPHAKVELFGSYASGLALPTSDIDIAVLGVDVRSAGAMIQSLEGVFRGFVWVASAHGIATASVPVLKLEVDSQCFGSDSRELVQVDVSFQDKDACGALATCAWAQKIVAEFPQIRTCVLVLKQLLHLHELNSTYYGGLNSYSLLLWTAAYVRTHSELPLDSLLPSLLRFYGEEFTPQTTAVDNSESSVGFPRLSHACCYCETIDPLQADNNTTKGAFRISQVQELFRRAFAHLRDNPSADALSALLSSPELIKF